jgi:hypothetical protein
MFSIHSAGLGLLQNLQFIKLPYVSLAPCTWTFLRIWQILSCSNWSPVFMTACHCTVFWARWIESKPTHPHPSPLTPLRPLTHFYLRLGLPSCPFPSVIRIIRQNDICISHMRTALSTTRVFSQAKCKRVRLYKMSVEFLKLFEHYKWFFGLLSIY